MRTVRSGSALCSIIVTSVSCAARIRAFGESTKKGRGCSPGLSVTLVWLLLRSPELAVEPVDQALAVLVDLLVGPEVPDLLGAQPVEPLRDLIDVLLVVTGDREGGRRQSLLRAPCCRINEVHPLLLEGEHYAVGHPREREAPHGDVAPLPEETPVGVRLLLGPPEELLRHVLGQLGLLPQPVYPGLDGAPGELCVQLLRLHSVVRKDPGRLLRGPDHSLRRLTHLVEPSRSVRHNDTSMS